MKTSKMIFGIVFMVLAMLSTVSKAQTRVFINAGIVAPYGYPPPVYYGPQVVYAPPVRYYAPARRYYANHSCGRGYGYNNYNVNIYRNSYRHGGGRGMGGHRGCR